MFQGTGSDVGKSLLVAGIARAFKRRGLNVMPFKPQNMSNNAAVTNDGGEIGRAQALQAKACGVMPSVHMNPILLKPQSNHGSQVIVQGKFFGNYQASEYYKLKPKLLPKILQSFEYIQNNADLILVEGAGSPAEVNLRAGDIANMGFAMAVNIPVILIADIDRGGVLASIVGTYELLNNQERGLLKGYIINKFRGDVKLFEPALDIIKSRTRLDDFGILPWFDNASKLPAEDSVILDKPDNNYYNHDNNKFIRIIVPKFDHIANFDDLDPLRAELDVKVEFIKPGDTLPFGADIILLPGSKTTIADLIALKKNGWHLDILTHIRHGGMVVGICAGYQMLGREIFDPNLIEGMDKHISGLGLLDIETTIIGEKKLIPQQAIDITTNMAVSGYEMHMGKTTGNGLKKPMLRLNDKKFDGAISEDGNIMGCYLHGIFANDDFRNAFLDQYRSQRKNNIGYDDMIEKTLNQLADHMEEYINLDQLLVLAKMN